MISVSILPRISFALKGTPTTWGASRWGAWRRCKREHYLKFHLGLAPKARGEDDEEWEGEDDTKQRIGILVHSLLSFERQLHALEIPPELRGVEAAGSWRDVLEAAVVPGSWGTAYQPETCWEAERLLNGYEAKYAEGKSLTNGGFDESIQILAVEKLLSVPAGVLGPFPYTGRADCIVRMPGGEVRIVDTKTRVASFPKNRDKYARSKAVDPQFAGLSWLMRHEDETINYGEPAAVWIDGIIKTKLVKCDRLLVTPSEADLRFFRASQRQEACNLKQEPYEIDPASGEISQAEAEPVGTLGACAPEAGFGRCWAFAWCHGLTEETRLKHFSTRAQREAKEEETANERL